MCTVEVGEARREQRQRGVDDEDGGRLRARGGGGGGGGRLWKEVANLKTRASSCNRQGLYFCGAPLMSSQMAVDATDGRDASVICVKGHICSEHHFGEEQQKTLHCICTECGTRLNGSHSFRCSTCNYYVCDSCTAAVRQLASSRRWPMFCLDLPAFVACSNAVAIPLFRRMLRRLRPAAHPPPLLLRSSLMHGPLPVQLTHRARVRVHRVGLTLMLVLRLLRSSQTVVDGRMCAFASGILRRLSGGGCSIVRVRFACPPPHPPPPLSSPAQ